MTSKCSTNIRRLIPCILVLGAVVILSACQSTDPQLTSTAAYEEARAEFDRLLTTATVARARMQTTLDHAATRIGQAEDAGMFLRSNLINLGTDTDFIEESLGQLEDTATQGPPTHSVVEASTSVAAAAPSTVTPQTIVTPPAVTPAPTSTLSGPRLENVVMASGVNEFDCAIDVNPRFTPESTKIYVVGRAFNIPAGATISSSWQRSGTGVVDFSFHKEHEINDSCIWFFIDQTDTPFTLGSWSVDIRVDGVQLSSPVAFQIVNN